MLLLHITISIIAFDAYTRKSWLLIGYTVVAHATLSFAVRTLCVIKLSNTTLIFLTFFSLVCLASPLL